MILPPCPGYALEVILPNWSLRISGVSYICSDIFDTDDSIRENLALFSTRPTTRDNNLSRVAPQSSPRV